MLLMLSTVERLKRKKIPSDNSLRGFEKENLRFQSNDTAIKINVHKSG
jgi:hypothetical protein